MSSNNDDFFGGEMVPPSEMDFIERHFSHLRRSRYFRSNTDVHVAYMNVDVFKKKLTWKFIYDALLKMIERFPNMYRVMICLALLLHDEVSQTTDIWYPSWNSTISDEVDFMLIRSRPYRKHDLKIIREYLVRAEATDFINSDMQNYAENSRTSVAFPYYLHYIGILL